MIISSLRQRIFLPLIATLVLVNAPDSWAQIKTNRFAQPLLPNIVLIIANNLGPSDLGCYGQTQIKTPNIDQLATNGLRFNNFYAGDSLFGPSFCALMTGKDSGHGRIRGDGHVPLSADDLTLGDLLKKAGYATTMIGQWGLGGAGSTGVPSRHGFDDWFGYLEEATPSDFFPQTLNRSEINEAREVTVYENATGHNRYGNDYFTEAAANALRLKKPVWYKNYTPLFLCVSYTLPLSATNATTAFNDTPYFAESWPQPEKNRAAMITRLDKYVGIIVEKIKRYKLEDNTLIFFTSINGPQKEAGVDPQFFQGASKYRGGKGDLFEGGLRVPFIAVWPGRFPENKATDVPVAAWDIFPTVAEITRQPALATNAGLTGISFLPTLAGRTQVNLHAAFYWEISGKGFKQALRFDDWKSLREGSDGAIQLFNLHTDPSEKTDIAADHPETVARAVELFKTARTDDPDWPVRDSAEPAKK